VSAIYFFLPLIYSMGGVSISIMLTNGVKHVQSSRPCRAEWYFYRRCKYIYRSMSRYLEEINFNLIQFLQTIEITFILLDRITFFSRRKAQKKKVKSYHLFLNHKTLKTLQHHTTLEH
jgi:hypothetical protein